MAIVRAALRRITLVPSWRRAPSVAFSNGSKGICNVRVLVNVKARLDHYFSQLVYMGEFVG